MKTNEKGFGTLEIVLILVIVGIIGGIGWFTYSSQKSVTKTLSNTSQGAGDAKKSDVIVKNFEDCVKAGNPVQESFPETCTAKDGQSFAKVDPNPSSPSKLSESERLEIAGLIADDCIAKHAQTPDAELWTKQQTIDFVLARDDKLFRSDGKFAYVSAACAEGPGGGFAVYLKKDPAWKLLFRTQDYPGCEYVDGASVAVVPQCYDNDIQDVRQPKP